MNAGWRARAPWIVGPLVVVALVAVPWVSWKVPLLLPGATDRPGALQLMATCFAIAALALSYHLLFGVAGLLSFGHALYFAAGTYGVAILLDRPAWPLLTAVAVTIAGTAVLAGIVGAISLRVSGISFAMVTLAFAQAGNVLVRRNPHRLTGGDEGLALETDRLPSQFIGVVNTRYLYWVALGVCVLVFVVVAWVEHSRAGHVAAAARENDLRVRVIGERPKIVQLVVYVVAGVLASLAGISYVLLQSGAGAKVTTADFTLTLLVMVVLGGVGSRWGAVVGAVAYTIADHRLGALASSDTIRDLPGVLRVPLSQPLFILGAAFVLVVVFLPGGVAGTLARLTHVSTAGVLADLDAEVAGDAPDGERRDADLESAVGA